MRKRDLGAIGIVAALLLLNFKLSPKKQLVEEDYADDEIQKIVKRKISRLPASAKIPSLKTELFKPQLTQSTREQHRFIPPEEPENVGGSTEVQNTGSFYISGDSGGDYRWGGSNDSPSSSNQSVPNSDKTSSMSNPTGGIVSTNSPWPGYSGGGASGSSSDDLSCKSSLGGGAYGNPIEVSLTCTAPSEIRYCVSVGTCCDPVSSGLVYSSKIIIGEEAGDYCLSFYGRDASDSETKIIQRNYNIDLTLPNLEVTHPKRYYQTTELSGVSHIASDMFGSINFGVGVINLKSNDPGPAGMNLGCEEIVTNYVALQTPAPIEILSFFNTVSVSPMDQLNVPLRLDQLIYGDNFITSYMTNNNFVTPLYSCSTTKVRLEDFDYFQADASHAVGGTNEVREFSGGFSGYGFFEAENSVYRGPAGESMASSESEVLETGLFSVFY